MESWFDREFEAQDAAIRSQKTKERGGYSKRSYAICSLRISIYEQEPSDVLLTPL